MQRLSAALRTQRSAFTDRSAPTALANDNEPGTRLGLAFGWPPAWML